MNKLDQLIAALEQALSDQDWDELVRLNEQVKPAIESVMESLEAGHEEPEQVRVRLETLRRFVETAGAGASQAKAEAEAALKGVSRNRNAAQAYAHISSTRSK